MKKILFIFAALLTAVFANAKGDECVVLQSGSLTEMTKEMKQPVYVEFDYSKATIDGKAPKEWLTTISEKLQKKFPEQLTESEEMFRTGIKGKYLICTGDKSMAKFIIIFKIGEFNPGKNNAAKSILAANISSDLSGTVEIYKPEEKAPFAVFQATKVPGMGDTYSERRQFCYGIVGQYVADYVKKEAKKK